MAEDIVYFLMPDGTKVSNDPRWAGEQAQKAREKSLGATPNTGKAVPPADEVSAQLRSEGTLANLQSGQPGVGENAVPDDASEYTQERMRSPREINAEARQRAIQEAGGAEDLVPNRTEREVEDSNEKVNAVREAREKRMEKAREAQEKLGDEGPGDPDKSYSEWSGKQLKAEALRRNAERENEEDRIQLKGVRKSGELASLLEEDDRRQAGVGTTDTTGTAGSSDENASND